jgi:hypothetical protein
LRRNRAVGAVADRLRVTEDVVRGEGSACRSPASRT